MLIHIILYLPLYFSCYTCAIFCTCLYPRNAFVMPINFTIVVREVDFLIISGRQFTEGVMDEKMALHKTNFGSRIVSTIAI